MKRVFKGTEDVIESDPSLKKYKIACLIHNGTMYPNTPIFSPLYFRSHKARHRKKDHLNGTISVVFSEPPCKDGNVGFTTVGFKALSDKE